MTTVEVLRATRRRLADPAHWSESGASSPGGGQCIGVALTRVSGVLWSESHRVVTRVVCGDPHSADSLHAWNDDPRTTHADVLAVLDRAISLVRNTNAEPVPKDRVKRCPACGETKPAGEFGPNRARRDGLQAQCRACRYPVVDARRAERWETDPEFRARVLLRQRANKQVTRAVAAGALTKPHACERCGAELPLQGHHWHNDYVKRPLEVEWLCSLCHGEAHRVVRGPNAEPADTSVESHPRVEARRPVQAGSDGWGAAPTLTVEHLDVLADALAAPGIRED